MKAPVDLPEELLIEVRGLAEQRGWKVRQVFEESLRAFLDIQTEAAPTVPFRLKHTIVHGRGLPEMNFNEMLEMSNINRLKR